VYVYVYVTHTCTDVFSSAVVDLACGALGGLASKINVAAVSAQATMFGDCQLIASLFNASVCVGVCACLCVGVCVGVGVYVYVCVGVWVCVLLF